MKYLTAQALFVPFFGTALGAACVLFIKTELSRRLNCVLTGFAAGVMTAASVWSLLIPSVERSASLGKLAFFPAVAGFLIGIFFLIATEKILARIDTAAKESKSILLLVFAVVLHNIPEGMAVGAVLAAYLVGEIAVGAVLSLAFGIAIQNFPEGAIISMPLAASGYKKVKALFYGILSGAVEPIACALTVLLSSVAVPALPYLLGFAAGAMIFVVVRELVPENCEKNSGMIAYALGFLAMMTLDIVFS